MFEYLRKCIVSLFTAEAHATDLTTYTYGLSADSQAGVNGSNMPSTGTATGTVFSDAQRAIWSKDIEYKAMPNLMFDQFAVLKTELGMERGRTIEMLHMNDISLGGRVEENNQIATQSISGYTTQITVQEYANAVSVSEFFIQSSFIRTMDEILTLMGRSYAKTLDCLLRDTALTVGATNTVYCKDGDSAVSSRNGLNSNCTFKVSAVQDAIEILTTQNFSPFNNQNWICFVHPHQYRSIKDDKRWINAVNYGDPTRIFRGEVGSIENTRFIQTSLMCNGAASTSDAAYKAELDSSVTPALSTDVYQSVLFGDRFYALAVRLPVELRDNGIKDYGRTREFAWYTILGTGVLEHNGVVIESA